MIGNSERHVRGLLKRSDQLLPADPRLAATRFLKPYAKNATRMATAGTAVRSTPGCRNVRASYRLSSLHFRVCSVAGLIVRRFLLLVLRLTIAVTALALLLLQLGVVVENQLQVVLVHESVGGVFIVVAAGVESEILFVGLDGVLFVSQPDQAIAFAKAGFGSQKLSGLGKRKRSSQLALLSDL